MNEIVNKEGEAKRARALDIARRSFETYAETYVALADRRPNSEAGNQADRKF
jgi:hypothetical protein